MMKPTLSLLSAAGVAAALLPAVDVQAQTVPRSYTANYTFTPPKIDGQIDPNEWDAASTDGGSWGVLRKDASVIDSENTRFRMLWDENYLYILVESDKNNWPADKGDAPVDFVPGQQIQGISFGADNINFYIDPNNDKEPNERLDNNVDGYQIAWNQNEGVGSFGDDGTGKVVFKNTGLFLEDHVNTPFGNQGNWLGLRKSKFVQVHGSSGGLIEFALAWKDIDAPNRRDFAANPGSFPADTGTAHPFRPNAGDQWMFDVSRISSDGNNFLPIWSWHPGQSFATAPHGTVEFAGGPRSYEVKYSANKPTIDGQVNVGEWDDAVVADQWPLLRKAETDIDTHNNRFRMKWDEKYLYILVESDYGNWSASPGENTTTFEPGKQIQGISFGADNLNIYIDPNTDKESGGRPDGEVDGYQIAWNQFMGTGSLGDDGSGNWVFKNTGLFLEDHINTPFGDQGRWQGLRKSSFVQNNTSSGGVTEFALAWADIDAPNPQRWADDPDKFPSDNGTYHPRHPNDGDSWIFDISRITSDPNNFLPIWSWHPGQSFAPAPHGTIQFTGGPRTYQAYFTSKPPTIDGAVADGEWALAAGGGDNWHILRRPEADIDSENTRFKVLWDYDYLYFLVQSDRTTWNPATGVTTPFVPGKQIQGINFGAENINFYLDPNTDNEDTFRPDSEVDGYQIAWNQLEGTGSLGDDGAGGQQIVNTGLFLEDHLNTPFGNQGNWQGLRKSSFVQVHGTEGGVIEFALAWADIDAPRASDFKDGVLPEGTDIGTYHPQAADNGERWIFDISRITTDPNNFLPIWSWHPGQSFATAPHGLLEFIGPNRPRFKAFTRSATANHLEFTTSAGSKYDIEYSANLTTWEAIATDITGTGAAASYDDADAGRVGAKASFYRVVAK